MCQSISIGSGDQDMDNFEATLFSLPRHSLMVASENSFFRKHFMYMQVFIPVQSAAKEDESDASDSNDNMAYLIPVTTTIYLLQLIFL